MRLGEIVEYTSEREREGETPETKNMLFSLFASLVGVLCFDVTVDEFAEAMVVFVDALFS